MVVEEKVVLVVEEYEAEVDVEEFNILRISFGIEMLRELPIFDDRGFVEAVIAELEVEVIMGGDEEGLLTEEVIIGKAGELFPC